MNLQHIHLTSNRVLIEPEDDYADTKLVIPEFSQEVPHKGRVVLLGPGKRDKDGKLITFTVKVGDRVVINKFQGDAVEIDGHQFLVAHEDDILAVLPQVNKNVSVPPFATPLI